MEWIVFVVCAVVAALSGTIALNSGGSNEHWYGAMVMIFSSLASITLPLLLVVKGRKKGT